MTNQVISEIANNTQSLSVMLSYYFLALSALVGTMLVAVKVAR